MSIGIKLYRRFANLFNRGQVRIGIAVVVVAPASGCDHWWRLSLSAHDPIIPRYQHFR
ncbi:hypothetical protein [Prochlorococcus marinus]|uniref:hypothetical protein n=1 Tax=Prochlorococcus marinus TaxID=1219 RepID=UPI000326A086|nr:hypothetical protein [Prochlorococcus marinus]